MGGLVMMRSTPAGKAFVKSSGVMVLASMGRRVSQPSIASWGSRSGYLALRQFSRHVAMPPQISTKWMGMWGRMYLGVSTRAGFDGGLEGRGGSLGGVRGDMAARRPGRVSWGGPLGGVGLSLRLPCIREESELFCRHVTCDAQGRCGYLMDPFNAGELVSDLIV